MNIQEIVAKLEGFLPGAERLAKLDADLASANKKATDESARATDFEARAAQATEKFTTAHARATELEASVAAKDAEIVTLKAAAVEHGKALVALEADVDKRAGIKGAAIAAGRGLKVPIKDEKAAGAGGETIHQQFAAITDPAERSKFYQEHRKELLG